MIDSSDHDSVSYSPQMTNNSSFENLQQFTANSSFQDFSFDMDQKHGQSNPHDMFSWMICQLGEDNKPYNLLYGQFSATTYPPKTGWVFLANNKEHNPNKLPVSTFQQIKVSQKTAVDDSIPREYDANTPMALRHGTAPSRYYKVSGCPVPRVNGRYLNDGMYNQPKPTEDSLDITLGRTSTAQSNSQSVIKYRNVHEFFILRYVLQEIPELGIVASTSYAMSQGGSVTEGMNMLAETANDEILRSNGITSIKDGSHDFKSRFIAISRAGNKMISVDQTLQTHHNNSLKAALRNKKHQGILDQLALMSNNEEEDHSGVRNMLLATGNANNGKTQMAQSVDNYQMKSGTAGLTVGTGTAVLDRSTPQKFSQTYNSHSNTFDITGRDNNFDRFNNAAGSALDTAQLTSTFNSIGIKNTNINGDDSDSDDSGIFNALLDRPNDWFDTMNASNVDADNISANNSVDGSLDSEYTAQYQEQVRLFSTSHLPINRKVNRDDDMSLGSKSTLDTRMTRASKVSKGSSKVSKDSVSKHLSMQPQHSLLQQATEQQQKQQQKQQQQLQLESTAVADKESAEVKGSEPFSDFDTQFILSKRVQYQSSTTLNSSALLPVPKDSYNASLQGGKDAAAGATELSSSYLTAESEISLEINRYIETREALLTKIHLKTSLLHKNHVESEAAALVSSSAHTTRPNTAESYGNGYGSGYKPNTSIETLDTEADEVATGMLISLCEMMREMRAVTIDLADAYATWVRIIYKQQKSGNNRNRKAGDNGAASKGPKYAVVIAYKSVDQLYPMSKAVHSNTKKFSRDFEPAKLATDHKLIGCYDTREEAVEAYTTAFNEIPLERVIHKGRGVAGASTGSAEEMCVNKRSCGLHYIVRNTAVASDLVCEQCAAAALLTPAPSAADAHKETTSGAPQSAASTLIYPVYDTAIAQYIYKGENYIAKMWGDLDFINDCVALKRALNATSYSHLRSTADTSRVTDSKLASALNYTNVFLSNPLLLHSDDLLSLLTELRARYYKPRPKQKHNAPKYKATDPFGELQGKTERNIAAALGGTGYNSFLVTKAFQDGYKESPFNLTQSGSEYAHLVKSEITYVNDNKPKQKKGAAALMERMSQSLTMRSTSATAILPLSSYKQGVNGGSLFTSSTATNNNSAYSTNSISKLCFDSESIAEDSSYRQRLVRCLYILAATSAVGSEALQNKLVPPIITPVIYTSPSKDRDAGFHPDQSTMNQSMSLGNMLPSQGSLHQQSTTSNGLLMLQNSTTTGGYSTSQTALTSGGDKSLMSQTVAVEVSYDYRGTSTTKVQNRKPNAFRDPTIFARTDKGEWATGFEKAKGRNMRHFEYEEMIYTTGKQKEEDRKRLQQMIRAAVAVHVVDIDVEYIESLIAQAKQVRGSVLALDIIQAENMIAHYHTACAAIVKIQLAYHCFRSRKLVASIKKVVEMKIQTHILTARQSHSLAHAVVPSILQTAVLNRVKYLTKPLFKYTMNYSGQLLVISILRDVRPFRKPVSVAALCESCQSRSVVIKRNGSIFDYDRTPYNEQLYDEDHLRHKNTHHKYIHTYHRHRVNHHVNSYKHADQSSGVTHHTEYKNVDHPEVKAQDHNYQGVLNDNAWLERTPCTCQYVQQREGWLLYIYNPLTQFSMKHSLGIDKVKSILLGLQRVVAHFMSPQHIARSLIGSNFDKLQPLFYPTSKCFSGIRLDNSYSNARWNAAAESSVLPLLPTSMPAVIMKCVQANNSNTDTSSGDAAAVLSTTPNSVMVNGMQKFYTVTPKPLSIRGYSDVVMHDTSGKSWDWQPLAELEQLQHNITQCQSMSVIYKTQMERSHEILLRSEEACSASNQQFHNISMEYEDMRSLLMRTQEHIRLADERIKAVMLFSQQLANTVSNQEQHLEVDDSQAYDDNFEDGHQYRGMNQKRRLEALYLVQYDAFHRKRDLFNSNKNNIASNNYLVHTNRTHYLTTKKRYEQSGPAIAYAVHLQATIKAAVREAICGILTTFSMPRKLLPKNHFSPLDNNTSEITNGADDNGDDASELVLHAKTQDRRGAINVSETEANAMLIEGRSKVKDRRGAVNITLDQVTTLAMAPVSKIVKFKQGNRRIQRIPYNFVFVRDHLERLRIEYRSMLTVLVRKVMVLRPLDINKHILERQRDVKGLLRCVVIVYMDSLSGYFVIHVGQDSLPVEESVQHINLGLSKTDFSHLTSHGLENDILLRRADVDALLAKPLIVQDNRNKRVSSTIHRRVAQVDTRAQYSSGVVAAGPHMEKKRSFLLPSETQRSLDGVRVHKNGSEKFATLSRSYKTRLDAREANDQTRAERLLEYLRLQPYTGRPCIGLLHFSRLTSYSTKKIKESLWMNDVQHNTPLLLINNHFKNMPRRHYKNMVNTAIYSLVAQSEVQFTYPYVNMNQQTVSITVPTEYILSSLQRKPLLFSSYLAEMITNTFSHYTHSHILDHVYFSVPSVLSNSWRNYMRDEVPNLHYLRDIHAGFAESPVYRTHRFVNSIYCYCEYYTNMAGDIKIVVSKPRDGRFHYHCYKNKPLDILIMRDELLVLVCKIAVNKNMVEKSNYRNVTLLHPNNLVTLLLAISDCIYFTNNDNKNTSINNNNNNNSGSYTSLHDIDDTSTVHSGSILNRHKLSTDEDPNVLTLPVVTRAGVNEHITVNFTLLEAKLSKLIQQFNHWLVKHRHDVRVATIGSGSVENVYDHLSNFYAPQYAGSSMNSKQLSDYNRYTFTVDNNKSTLQLVPVFNSVVKFLDLNKYYGNCHRKQLQKHIHDTLKGVNGSTADSLHDLDVNIAKSYHFLPKTITDGTADALVQECSFPPTAFETMLDVSVFTNTEKTKLYIDIFTADCAHLETQQPQHHDVDDAKKRISRTAAEIITENERCLFACEDARSGELRTMYTKQEYSLKLLATIQSLKQNLQLTLLPQLQKANKRRELIKTQLQLCREKLSATYFYCLEYHGQTLVHQLLMALQNKTTGLDLTKPSAVHDSRAHPLSGNSATSSMVVDSSTVNDTSIFSDQATLGMELGQPSDISFGANDGVRGKVKNSNYGINLKLLNPVDKYEPNSSIMSGGDTNSLMGNASLAAHSVGASLKADLWDNSTVLSEQRPVTSSALTKTNKLIQFRDSMRSDIFCSKVLLDIASDDYLERSRAALSHQFLDLTVTSPFVPDDSTLKTVLDWCNECISAMQYTFDINNYEVTGFDSNHYLYLHVTKVNHESKLTNKIRLSVHKYMTSTIVSKTLTVGDGSFRQASQWQRRQFRPNKSFRLEESKEVKVLPKVKTRWNYTSDSVVTTTFTRKCNVNTVTTLFGDVSATPSKNTSNYKRMTLGNAECVMYKSTVDIFGNISMHIYNVETSTSYILNSYSQITPPVATVLSIGGNVGGSRSRANTASSPMAMGVTRSISSRMRLGSENSFSPDVSVRRKRFLSGGSEMMRERSASMDNDGQSIGSSVHQSNNQNQANCALDAIMSLQNIVMGVAQRFVFHVLMDGCLSATITAVTDTELSRETKRLNAAVSATIDQITYCEECIESFTRKNAHHEAMTVDNESHVLSRYDPISLATISMPSAPQMTTLDQDLLQIAGNYSILAVTIEETSSQVSQVDSSTFQNNTAASASEQQYYTLDETENEEVEEDGSGTIERPTVKRRARFVPKECTDKDMYQNVGTAMTILNNGEVAVMSGSGSASGAASGAASGVVSRNTSRRNSVQQAILNLSRRNSSAVPSVLPSKRTSKVPESGFPIVGFLIPQDQTQPAVPIRSSTKEFLQTVVYSYLGITRHSDKNADHLHAVVGSALDNEESVVFSHKASTGGGDDDSALLGRQTGLCGIMYFNLHTHDKYMQQNSSTFIAPSEPVDEEDALLADGSDGFNVRAHAAVSEFGDRLGYRTERLDKIKLKTLTRMLNHLHSVEPSQPDGQYKVYGDVVLMLRFGEVDAANIWNHLVVQFAAYGPKRALRLQLQGNREQFKMMNYLKYRKVIFDLAEVFLVGAEHISDNFFPHQRTAAQINDFDSVEEFTAPPSTASKELALRIFGDLSILAVETRLLISKFNSLLQQTRKLNESTSSTHSNVDVSYLQYALLTDSEQMLSVMHGEADFTSTDSRHEGGLNRVVFNLFKEKLPSEFDISELTAEHQSEENQRAESVIQPAHLNLSYLKKFTRRELSSECSDSAAHHQAVTKAHRLSRSSQLFATPDIYMRHTDTASETGEVHTYSELVVTTGQVVYAMYQLHCHNCTLPLNCCKFPGCGAIRGHAAALTDGLKFGEGRVGDPHLDSVLSTLKGTGRHPIEVATLQYFTTMTNASPDDRVVTTARDNINNVGVFLNHFPELSVALLTHEDGLSPEEEMVAEQDEDNRVVASHEYNHYLSVKFRELAVISNIMRVMHVLLVNKTFCSIITSGVELLEARGDVTQMTDETAVGKLIDELRLVQQQELAEQTHNTWNSSFATYTSTQAINPLDAIKPLPEISSNGSACSEDTSTTSQSHSLVSLQIGSGIVSHAAQNEHNKELLAMRQHLNFLRLEDKVVVEAAHAWHASDVHEVHILPDTQQESHGSGLNKDKATRRKGIVQQSALTAAINNAKPKIVHSKRFPFYTELPYSILSGLLGIQGIDAMGNSVPPKDMDPYPNIAANDIKPTASSRRGGRSAAVPHAMSPTLFHWLVSHLRLIRDDKRCITDNAHDGKLSAGSENTPAEAKGAVGEVAVEANAHLTEKLHFTFDRLHCESIVTLSSLSSLSESTAEFNSAPKGAVATESHAENQWRKTTMSHKTGKSSSSTAKKLKLSERIRNMSKEDSVPGNTKRRKPVIHHEDADIGTTVVIQVLHGIIQNVSSILSADSGVPPVGVRYISTEDLSAGVLSPGLTILAYDVQTNVSYGIPIADRGLSRVVDYFNISDKTDYPAIATAILQNAADCLAVDRIEQTLVSIRFDMSRLELQKEKQNEIPGSLVGKYVLHKRTNEIYKLVASTEAVPKPSSAEEQQRTLVVQGVKLSSGGMLDDSVIVSQPSALSMPDKNISTGAVTTALKSVQWSGVANATENSYFTAYDNETTASSDVNHVNNHSSIDVSQNDNSVFSAANSLYSDNIPDSVGSKSLQQQQQTSVISSQTSTGSNIPLVTLEQLAATIVSESSSSSGSSKGSNSDNSSSSGVGSMASSTVYDVKVKSPFTAFPSVTNTTLGSENSRSYVDSSAAGDQQEHSTADNDVDLAQVSVTAAASVEQHEGWSTVNQPKNSVASVEGETPFYIGFSQTTYYGGPDRYTKRTNRVYNNMRGIEAFLAAEERRAAKLKK